MHLNIFWNRKAGRGSLEDSCRFQDVFTWGPGARFTISMISIKHQCILYTFDSPSGPCLSEERFDLFVSSDVAGAFSVPFAGCFFSLESFLACLDSPTGD